MVRTLKISEHDMQTIVCSWWAHACGTYGLPHYALLAIPNAGKRSYAAAAWLRAEGLQPGTPDLFLAVPKRDADPFWMGGLWIEMKRKPNKPDESQQKMIQYLECAYTVRVCYSADEAISEIKRYLGAIRCRPSS